MQTHYDILGIQQTATSEQIKTAFRRLAKLYHPDKNPQGKNEFEKILNAYEVLINVSRRNQYDLRIKHGSSIGYYEKKSNTKKQKDWSFSDEELKRRQYYKEHYKKEYERQNGDKTTPKKNYNEYKYILFAAPLAVGLLMFIMNIYEQSQSNSEKSKTQEIVKNESDELKMTDNPLANYFTQPIHDTTSKRVVVIKNFSASDVLIAIFDNENNFLRSGVIKTGFYIEVPQLPNCELNFRIATGKNWSKNKTYNGLDFEGGFIDKEKFYKVSANQFNGLTISIDDKMLELLESLNEQGFFAKN